VRGEKAPFKKDLQEWLQSNPGYVVWEPPQRPA